MSNVLPAGFAELERFVEYWIADTSQQRVYRRSEASMEDIKEFYDAVFARAKDILDHLEPHGLHDLPSAEAELYKILLALPHAAVSVECHRQPRVPYAPYPNGIRLMQTPQPYG